MSNKTLGEKLNCTMAQATSFISSFFRIFPQIKTFREKAINYCEQNKFVKTILGRRRHIPEINSDVGALCQAAKRKVLSSIIQGSASDIVNQAMIFSCAKIKSTFPPSNAKLVLQIHDEFLFECPSEGIIIFFLFVFL